MNQVHSIMYGDLDYLWIIEPDMYNTVGKYTKTHYMFDKDRNDVNHYGMFTRHGFGSFEL